jgi:hypothetical protein
MPYFTEEQIDNKIDELQNKMCEKKKLDLYPRWTIMVDDDYEESFLADGTVDTWNNVLDNCRYILENINDYDCEKQVKLILELDGCNVEDIMTLYECESVYVYKIDYSEKTTQKRLIELGEEDFELIKDDENYFYGTCDFEGFVIKNQGATIKPLDKKFYEEEPYAFTYISNSDIKNFFYNYFDTKTLEGLEIEDGREMYIHKPTEYFDIDSRETWIDMIFSFEEMDGVFAINYNGSSLFALWNCGNEWRYYNEKDDPFYEEEDEEDEEEHTKGLLDTDEPKQTRITIKINITKKQHNKFLKILNQKKQKILTK